MKHSAIARAAAIVVWLVVSAASVSAQTDDRVMRWSEYAVLAGHSLDIAATQHCVGAGRCRELNPWLARYENPVAFAGAKLAVGGLQLWAMRKLHHTHPRWARVANFGIAGGFGLLAIRNTQVGK